MQRPAKVYLRLSGNIRAAHNRAGNLHKSFIPNIFFAAIPPHPAQIHHGNTYTSLAFECHDNSHKKYP